MLIKSLIQFSVDGWGCVFSLLFTWGQTVVEVMKIMATSFKRSYAGTTALCACNCWAGRCQPACARDSWTLMGKSGSVSRGSLLLSPGSWCTQGAVRALPEFVSLVLCEFWWLCGDLLQEGLCHTQVYCTQSPCPCGRALLAWTSTGDSQTQFCLSLCGISGSWCTQGFF